jgi:hypothetical protein
MERKIVDYNLISAGWHDELSGEIKKQLAQGWDVYGAPFCDNVYLYQAMVKYEITLEESSYGQTMIKNEGVYAP